MNIEEAVQEVRTEFKMYEHGIAKLLAGRCEHNRPMNKHCEACYQQAIDEQN